MNKVYLYAILIVHLSCLTSVFGHYEVNIRKEGSAVITSVDGVCCTTKVSRAWLAHQIEYSTNQTLNITCTLGAMTLPEAVDAIEAIGKSWLGQININIAAVREDGSVVVLRICLHNRSDMRVLRSYPVEVSRGVSPSSQGFGGPTFPQATNEMLFPNGASGVTTSDK